MTILVMFMFAECRKGSAVLMVAGMAMLIRI